MGVAGDPTGLRQGACYKLGTQQRRVGGEMSDDCEILPRGQASGVKSPHNQALPEQG